MTVNIPHDRCRFRALTQLLTLLSLVAGLIGSPAPSAQCAGPFYEGNLVVSRSVYDNNPNNINVGTILPPNCASTQGGCSGGALNDGTYPFVFNNDQVDGSFGITSKILLDQISPSGSLVNSLEVPNSSIVPPSKDQMVTSFSSKSELALNLSSDRKYLTFMGYIAPIDAIDVSNSNTPGVVDPTNPVGMNYFRAVARVDENGKFQFTETNAYSGNNGRAAVMHLTRSANFVYTAGNAGNGGNPQPSGIVMGAGAQILTPLNKQVDTQNPGDPAPVASFNITQLGHKADKIGKDNNFRAASRFSTMFSIIPRAAGATASTRFISLVRPARSATMRMESGSQRIPQACQRRHSITIRRCYRPWGSTPTTCAS